MLPVEIRGLRPGLPQIRSILIASHSEIREVVKEVAENRLAIFLVSPGVEDMEMPKCVDLSGWNNRSIRVSASQLKEFEVFSMNEVCVLSRPPFTFFCILKLEFEQSEIQRCNIVRGERTEGTGCDHIVLEFGFDE